MAALPFGRTETGIAGYQAYWVFTDQGEPGTSDTAAIKITDPTGNTTVLRVGTLNVNGGGNITSSNGVNLTFGNQQAHK